jgi:uncharacterized protein YjbI with pentapeptide repeats
MNELICDKEFTNSNFSEINLDCDYEACIFTNCNFSKANLRTISFSECEFIECDFSNAKLDETAFKDIHFKNCKLLGLRFDSCNPFLLAFNFTNCTLNFSSFYQLNIENTRFMNCKMQEVDFAETNLTKVLFDNCDLKKTIFENTNLFKANLSTALNFDINPVRNNIKKAKFSKNNIIGLLSEYDLEITNS